MIFLPIALFFLGLAGLALWSERISRRRGAEDFSDDYFLGSRGLRGVVLAMTLTATYGSVSSFVSGPGIAWNLGLGWVVFAAPQIIAGFLVLGILGKKMALASRVTGSITVVDLIRARYGSRLLAWFCAAALLIFFTAMMTGQFVGGAAIFAETAGIDPAAGLVVFGLLVVFYTTFGGFRAVAVTDTLCALLMLSGMAMLGSAITDEAGGLEAAMLAAAHNAPNPEAFLSFDAGGALPISLLFSAWILVGFGTAGLPQSAVRCMSYRKTSDLHLAMIVGTAVCGALMIGMTTLGVLARAVATMPVSELGTTDHLVPRLIAGHMHPLAAGVTLIGPLAATMSTVSSLLIAASSAVVKDLLLDVRPQFARNLRGLQRVSRGATLVLGLLALLFALNPPDIVAWINLGAFGGLELAFLLPLVCGLFWRRANAAGALLSVAGSLVFYVWALVVKPPLGGFHAIVPAFVVAALLFVLGSLLGKPTEARLLRPFFAPSPRRD